MSCPIRNLAIIPVRTGSKRLPNKNTRDFFGKPMFLHTVDYARQAGLFEEIIVSTEAEWVRDMCSLHGLEIPFLRPAQLASDTAKLVDVCRHVLDTYEMRGKRFDGFCLLWATAPMRTDEDIRIAYRLLEDDTEAVVGVTDYGLPVYCAQTIAPEGWLKPLFPDMLRLPSSSMPRTVVDNGSLCWVRNDAFRMHGTWLPPRLRGYWMPRWASVDIETEEDWEYAEFCYRRHVLGGKGQGGEG